MIKTLLNWLAIAGVLTVNALANILPINGMNTGEISALYPNRFVPAGFTFGIWSIIYLLLLAYTVAYSYYQLMPRRKPEITRYLDAINPLYLLTCVWNAGWILAWHYLSMILSVMIMLAFLFTLILLFRKAHPFGNRLPLMKKLCLFTPFVTYFSWICVATIANITALLVSLGWQGAGIPEAYWSVALILVALSLGIYILLNYRVPAFALVLAWALWGIRAAQSSQHPLLEWIPFTGILLLALGVIYVFSVKPRAVPVDR